MKIYMRTEEGQEAAYSPQSALPRKLKSILKVVDGKTRNNVFRKNLHSFGDVDGLLRSLELAGLLKVASEGTQDGRVNLDSSTATRSNQLREQDWSATRNPLELNSQQSAFQSPSQPYYPSVPGGANGMAGAVTDPTKQAALKGVLDDMANFVLTHLPDQSFQILKEIEEITSLEVLAATLGGYEQMVSGVGQLSAGHLSHIKSVLRQYL